MLHLRLLSVLLLLAVGCSEERSVPVTPPPAAEQLKLSLEEIASSGQIGSAAEELDALVERLEEHDPAKGAELQADLEELRAARGAAAVRTKAKAMAEKL